MNARGRQVQGAASVEMALLLVFFLVPLVIGLIDFGQLIHAQHVVTRAAREGAMAATRGGDATAAVEAVISGAGLDPALVRASQASDGEQTSVAVVYDTAAMVIIPWKDMIPDLSNVTATAVVRGAGG